MPTVILTGCTGQDGALLSRFLLNKGYNVIGMIRRSATPDYWRLQELKVLGNPRFEIASGDLTDQGSIDRLIQEYQPDEFYNLGAQSFVKESWNTPVSTFDINAIGTLRCLEALRNYKKNCKFYQASSSEMFGGANRIEILDEDSPFHPRSPYGVSKVAAHYATINYRESYDMFACAGILFNHESEFRGVEFVTRKISKCIAEIRCGKRKKFGLGNIDACRDWGAAQDYIEAMWLMLQQDKPEDFVIATGESHSVREFLTHALNEVNLDFNNLNKYVEFDESCIRPADVGYLLGDASKAHEKLDWQKKTSFRDLVTIMVHKDIERLSCEASKT